jgi:hypothetical protein
MDVDQIAIREAVRNELLLGIKSQEAAAGEVDAIMSSLECLSPSASTGVGRAETIWIRQSENGSIRIATSRKLGNVRLKLGETLTRGLAEGGLTGAHLLQLPSHPIIAALYLLKFLHYVH